MEILSLSKGEEYNLFDICLCKYIKKTIAFSSMQIKKRYSNVKNTELLCLNACSNESDDEIILNISDVPVNFMDEIFKPENISDIDDIITDKKILQEFKKLTPREQEVIYFSVILGKKESTLASKLGVSRQAICKTKNTAIRKLRKVLLN